MSGGGLMRIFENVSRLLVFLVPHSPKRERLRFREGRFQEIPNKPSHQFSESEVPDELKYAIYLTNHSIVMDIMSCGGPMRIFEKVA